MFPTALTIAGSDPSGGAGLQADLKTFHQFGVYGMSVITLLTVQNTKGVSKVHVCEVDLVLDQLKAVLDDIPPKAVKTGALGNAVLIDAIAIKAESFNFPFIIDPVMISKNGAPLIDKDGEYALRKYLLPKSYLITPNIPEAESLSERHINNIMGLEKAAISISKLGVKHVLVKGGHLDDDATDVLYTDGTIYRIPGKKIQTKNTHGTGCAYSAAITACLAKGLPLQAAVKKSKEFIAEAIRTNPNLGEGFGPINMFAKV